MVIPWTLIVRVCEESVLQHFEIGENSVERQGVGALIALVKGVHELRSVVPGGVIAEVLVDDLLRHVALLLQERVQHR